MNFNRTTERIEKGCYANLCQNNYQVKEQGYETLEKDTAEAINKLGQVEDYEERISITIKILDELSRSKYVFVKKPDNTIVVGYVDNINLRKYLIRGRYHGVADIKQGFSFNFRDYGSKIALTKEELEK